MSIPTLQTSQVIPVNPGIRADSSALEAPSVAIQQAGSAISKSAQFLADFARHKEQSDNVAVMADSDRKMKVAFSDYQLKMAQEGDETKWQEGWKKEVDALGKDLFSNEGLTTESKAALQLKYNDWSTDTSLRVRSSATKRGIQRNKAQLEGAIESDLEEGDIESATAKIRAGEGVGLYSPEAAQKRIEKAESRVDYYTASNMAQADPEGTYELLNERTDTGRWKNFKNLAPDSRKSLMGYARKEAGQRQSDYYSDLIFKTADEGAVSIDQIELDIEDGKLTKSQGAAYINRFHSDSIPSYKPDAYAEGLRAVEAYNPDDDPYFEKYAKLSGDLIGLPSKQSTFLNKRLEKKLNQKGVGGSTETFVMKRLSDMFNDNFFSGGEKPTTPDEISEANLLYTQQVEAAQALVADNPNAPVSDILGQLLKQPTAKNIITTKAKQIQTQLSTVEPNDEEKTSALNNAMFTFYKSQFPGITLDMTFEQAVNKAASDAGGSLTPQQTSELKRFYRRLQ